MQLNPAHVAWCQNLWNMMADGGAWAVPRSGLIFNKRGGKLVLVARMPYDEEAMPGTITAEELSLQQSNDFEGTRAHFAAFGVTVEDETAL